MDLDGKLHRLGGDPKTKAVVVVFLATECPISNSYLPELSRLATSGRKQGFELYGVISSRSITRAAAQDHRKEYTVQFPVLFDASGELRQRLQPTHTPEAFVLSPDGTIRYRGQIDDRYAAVGKKRAEAKSPYLNDALAAVLGGKPVATERTEPVGCPLESLESGSGSQSVTYAREIAPILHAQCAACHRPGEAAPFSLLTYEDAQHHAPQIANLTASRQMPPWKAIPGAVHFKNERRLTDADIQLIQKWSDAGMPHGNAADLPDPPRFSKGWPLGSPDIVLEMSSEFEVPADGGDVIRHFVLPMNMRENRLISAIDFRAGNARVVHHACFFFDLTRTARQLDAADAGPGYGGGGGPGFVPQGSFRCWVPGTMPLRLPEGMGRPVPRGADLVLEIHYQCVGKAEKDRSSVGVYFAPRSARQVVLELQITNSDLVIPAGEPRYHHHATYTLPVDALLLDLAPHMHTLGREVTITMTKPNGQPEPLLSIHDWDFRWQGQYVLAHPLKLPKGTRLDLDAWFDNSAGNSLNPSSPPREVRWGEQTTTDEMCLCYLHLTCDRAQDLMLLNKDANEYFARDLKKRPRPQITARTAK